MGKKNEWINKNVDLKQLAEIICDFLRNEDFIVELFEDKNKTSYTIQARKKGKLKTITGRRKSFQTIIEGVPSKFKVDIKGEMLKNFATGGLIGVGLNAKFQGKLWDFIQNTVVVLENSAQEAGPMSTYKTPPDPHILENKKKQGKRKLVSSLFRGKVKQKGEQEDPYSILQKRLAQGEIDKNEYLELLDLLKSPPRDNANSVTITHNTHDDTQFWSCPKCNGVLEQQHGRQYCNTCKDYL